MSAITDFLGQIGPWHWAALGLLLLVIELLTGTMVLLWLAIAAGLTALALLAPGADPWFLGPAIFSGAAIVLSLAGDRFAKKFAPDQHTAPALDDPIQSLLGETGEAIGPIDQGGGRARLRDSDWNVRAADDSIGAGARLEVVRVDGDRLIVRALAQAALPAPHSVSEA